MTRAALASRLSLMLCLAAWLAGFARAGFDQSHVFVGTLSGQVFDVNPYTGSVTTFADGGDGLLTASELAFTRTGKMLVSDYYTVKVTEFDASGQGHVVLTAADGLLAPLGANGTAIDSLGRVYVADYAARIFRFNADYSGGIVFADLQDGLGHPDGIAFTAQGDLLATDRDTGNILRISPDGSATIFDVLPDMPFTIAVRSNGDCYVGCISGNVYRYVGGTPAGRVVLGTYGSLYSAMTFSPDETRIYHASQADGLLRAIDPDDGSAVTIAAGFDMPIGIGVATPRPFTTGHLFVTSPDSSSIGEIDPIAQSVTTLAGPGNGLSSPQSMCFTRWGTLLSANFADGNVLELDAWGNGKVVLGPADGVYQPFGGNGMAVDSSGRVYVSDLATNTIRRFESDYTGGVTFADFHSGLAYASGLAFLGSGDLMVASFKNGKVLRITPDGVASVMDVLTTSPCGIAARANGDLYVSCSNGSLYRYPDADPSRRMLLGSYGTGDSSLAFSADDAALYLCIRDASQVLALDPDTGSATDVVTELPGPFGSAVDRTVAVRPGSLALRHGAIVSGGLSDLLESDGQRLVVKKTSGTLAFRAFADICSIVVKGTAPTTRPVGLELTVEAAEPRNGVAETIQLYDYVQHDWMFAAFDVDLTTYDAAVHILINGDVSRFVDPATREMKASIGFRRPTAIPGAPVSASIDQVFWTVRR